MHHGGDRRGGFLLGKARSEEIIIWARNGMVEARTTRRKAEHEIRGKKLGLCQGEEAIKPQRPSQC